MPHRSPYPDVDIPSVSLYEHVFSGARVNPEKPALIDGPTGRTYSFRQLEEQVRRAAAGLHAQGFRPGDVFAFYSPNLPEYVVLFYAVNRLGGIVTTANPLYTAEELAYQLRDAGATWMVTVPPLLEVAREAAREAGVAQLYTFGEAPGARAYASLLAHGDVPPEVTIDPDAVAVLPYSSGTTGRPKGVMLTHRNLVANINQTLAVEQLPPEDVYLGLLPFYHIYGMVVIMSMALKAGGTIVTLPRFDLEQFLDVLQRYRVTYAHLVPPLLLALARHPAVDRYDLSALAQLISGAAPLPPPVAEACVQRLGCSVRQGYGLTETSPVTHLVPRDRPTPLTSVGVPVPNTEVRVVSLEMGEEVPPGERGELWIRGPQVMNGYHQRPDATAAMIDAEGWLHTGDVGYVDEQGNYYIVDRVKELIKYKGLQVAPAELEAVVQAHPSVADCAVIPCPDEEAGEVPKAVVVLKPGTTASAEEIMAFVAERVAPFKKVRRVAFVEGIPRVPSGKILRRKLIEQERAAAAAQA